jgi:hypothetical protein
MLELNYGRLQSEMLLRTDDLPPPWLWKVSQRRKEPFQASCPSFPDALLGVLMDIDHRNGWAKMAIKSVIIPTTRPARWEQVTTLETSKSIAEAREYRAASS